MAWRSLTVTAELNKDNMQGTGFGYAFLPILRKLYPETDGLKAALLRHLDYFNTFPGSAGYILGCTAQLEEQSVADPESIPPQTVDSIKVSLMGPLAGLGDNLMMSGLRVMLTIVGIDFALGGNWMGPVLFFLIFNTACLYMRLKGLKVGYEAGPSFIQNLQEQKVTERLAIWIGGAKAALVGYLIYRGVNMMQVPQLKIFDEALGQVLPKWSVLVLLAIGVVLYKKKYGRMVYIGLLALLSAVITYLMLQQ